MSNTRAPDPRALFCLIPSNDQARAVVEYDNNKHLVCELQLNEFNNHKCFDIGFHINGHNLPNTLVTLGRHGCNIHLTPDPISPSSISCTHCYFEIADLDTGIVMFHDVASNRKTTVSGRDGKGMPFQQGRGPKKILVCEDFNEFISINVVGEEQICFELHWLHNEDRIREIAREHRGSCNGIISNSMKMKAFAPPVTPDLAFQKLRYHTTNNDRLGAGTYGTVWRVKDVDSGRLMAMKCIQWSKDLQDQAYPKKVRQEVKLMRESRHEHIAEFIASEEERCSISIFMRLEAGSLKTLTKDKAFSNVHARLCLQQMLSALDFLADMNIVHRDVKPDNVLFSKKTEESYHFRLADFGLSKLAQSAYSFSGTDWYIAPEILKLGNRVGANARATVRQTPKVDVWSLFVTIAYARNVCNYQNREGNTIEDILAAVEEARRDKWMSKYKAMAVKDPVSRASAREILGQHFNGEGICTPKYTTEEMPDANAQVPESSSSRMTMQQGQIPPRSPRVTRSSKNKPIDQFRVNKTGKSHVRKRP